MNSGPEWTYVEQPLLAQLEAMGWKHTTGNPSDPSATGRESFRDVLLEDDLRAALVRINRTPDGQPWLDDERLAQAVNALKRYAIRPPSGPVMKRVSPQTGGAVRSAGSTEYLTGLPSGRA